MNLTFGIAIPTYNRKDKLKRCITSFIDDAKLYSIPIYISDNASNDGTEEVVKKLKTYYDNIYYQKNSKNLGLDQNMFLALKMSKCKFTLWLGDDDVLMEGGIKEILDNLDEKVQLLVLNSKLKNYKTNKEIENVLKLKENKIITKNEKFLLKYNDKLSFGTIVVRNYLDSIEVKKYIGSYHAYCEYIWEYLSKNKIDYIKIIAKECILWEVGDKEYNSQIIDIMYNKVPNMKFPEKYKAFSQIWLKNYLDYNTSIKVLLGYRKNSKQIRKIKRKDYNKLSYLQYLKLKIILFIPDKIIATGFKIKEILFVIFKIEGYK